MCKFTTEQRGVAAIVSKVLDINVLSTAQGHLRTNVAIVN